LSDSTGAAKERACAAVDSIAADLVALSRDIHAHPELKFEEHYACGQLVPFLRTHGFSVDEGAHGLETAFRGEWGHGPTTIAICAEYDALPEIGHACGHNLIATCGVGAAAALARALDPGDARIVLLGTPAEEGGGGKAILIERGAFAGVDVAMMAHPAPAEFVHALVLGGARVEVEYRGRASHQAAAPERGVNALDAIVTAYNAVAQLRQHIRRDARLGAIVTHGGDAVNVIPERAAGVFSVRAGTMGYLRELKERLTACLEAGALATGAELSMSWGEREYEPVRTNRPLAGAWMANGAAFGVEFLDLSTVPVGGTDMGNVSQVVPAIHPEFAIGTRAGNHTHEFAAASITDAAHDAMLRAAKMLAMTAIDVALDPALLRTIKADFAA
jgi:amidohydrolase